MRKLIGLVAFITIVALITTGIVFYARGYRPNFKERRLDGTGIVSVKSQPSEASVFIDGQEKGKTELDITDLSPGKYRVKILKEGYIPWEKEVVVKKEIVNLIEITLFPTAPSLQALTFVGVQSLIVSPSGDRIIFSSNGTKERQGLWSLNMADRTFPIFFSNDLIRVVEDSSDTIFSESIPSFSPDGKNLLVKVTETTGETYYLLDSTRLNENPEKMTPQAVEKLKAEWEKGRIEILQKNLQALGKEAVDFAAGGADIAFSKDKQKFIVKKENKFFSYNSKPSLVENLKPVFFELPSAKNYVWFTDNQHLLVEDGGSVSVVELEGTNKITIYTGSFQSGFLVPWPDGSRIVISTNFNSANSKLPNLYAIQLR